MRGVGRRGESNGRSLVLQGSTAKHAVLAVEKMFLLCQTQPENTRLFDPPYEDYTGAHSQLHGAQKTYCTIDTPCSHGGGGGALNWGASTSNLQVVHRKLRRPSKHQACPSEPPGNANMVRVEKVVMVPVGSSKWAVGRRKRYQLTQIPQNKGREVFLGSPGERVTSTNTETHGEEKPTNGEAGAQPAWLLPKTFLKDSPAL